MYNFDEVIDRNNTLCVKYDALEQYFGEKDLLPLWVADMDFAPPKEIVEEIQKRAQHPIYGYSYRTDSYLEAFKEWQKKRNNWIIEKEWICFSPGVVTALSLTIKALTNQGDKIIIQPPVYPPFYSVVKENKRELLFNPLIQNGTQYEINFTHLEELASNGAKMLIICNPHNPIGKAWSKEELIKISEICTQYGIIILSDEIHSDLVFEGTKHIPMASVSKDAANRTITCMAASKTFNIAGLTSSTVVISNKEIRSKYLEFINAMHLEGGNLFGNLSMEVAYKHGEVWLEQLINYIEKNYLFVKEYIEKNLPKVKVMNQNATFLMWLNFSEYNLTNKELQEIFIHKAKIAINDGTEYSEEYGEGFFRINIGCSRKILEECLERIKNSL